MSERATTASLFHLVWDELTGTLGAPAVAVLVRRAAKRAVQRRPDLDFEDLAVLHEELEYRYVLPASWREDAPGSREALRYFVRDELCPLLDSLTGSVVVDLLARLPALRQAEIFLEGSK